MVHMVQSIVTVKGRGDINGGPTLAELSRGLRTQEGFKTQRGATHELSRVPQRAKGAA